MSMNKLKISVPSDRSGFSLRCLITLLKSWVSSLRASSRLLCLAVGAVLHKTVNGVSPSSRSWYNFWRSANMCSLTSSPCKHLEAVRMEFQCLLLNLRNVCFHARRAEPVGHGLELHLAFLSWCIVHNVGTEYGFHKMVALVLTESVISRFKEKRLCFGANQKSNAFVKYLDTRDKKCILNKY
mmetsp:Transcript_70255/g.142688  ORF Transcript_70255/g.142688 Transcript_70255/m.142688 type:complete len:183 (-) Transcript_70255:620-1168(-)